MLRSGHDGRRRRPAARRGRRCDPAPPQEHVPVARRGRVRSHRDVGRRRRQALHRRRHERRRACSSGRARRATSASPIAGVSRRHASLEVTERGLRLTDLGSTNGTFVGPLQIVRRLPPRRRDGAPRRHDVRGAVARDRRAAGTAPAATRFGRLIGASPEMRRLYPLCERLAQSTCPSSSRGRPAPARRSSPSRSTRRPARRRGRSSSSTAPPSRRTSSRASSSATSAARSPARSTAQGRLRAGARRHAAHRRDRRSRRCAPAEAPPRDRASRSAAGRRRPSRSRSTCACIAATRRDLDREVQAGPLPRRSVPPPRGRAHRAAAAPPARGDVRVLARTSGASSAAIRRDAMPPTTCSAAGRTYPWPGNVRELRNAVARRSRSAISPPRTRRRGDEAAPAGAPPRAARARRATRWTASSRSSSRSLARARVLEEFERRYVEQVLAQHGGNVARAAAASGIGRRYFQRIKAKQKNP